MKKIVIPFLTLIYLFLVGCTQPSASIGTTTYEVTRGQSCSFTYSKYVFDLFVRLPPGVSYVNQSNTRIILSASADATLGLTQLTSSYEVKIVAPMNEKPVQVSSDGCQMTFENI